MAAPQLTRRRLLGTGAATGIAGLLGGCQVLGGGGVPSRSDASLLQHAPRSTIAAAHLDWAGLRNDEELRRAMDQQLRAGDALSERVPPSTRDALQAIDAAVGLDPTAVGDVLGVVVRTEGEPDRDGFDPLAGTSAGAVLRTDWSVTALREALRAQWSDVETGRRRGVETIETPALSVAPLEGGRLLAGQPAAVSALLAVQQGGETAEGGQLERALAATRPGPLRVAIAPRSGSDGGNGFGNPVALLAGKIDLAYGSLHAAGEGDERVLELVFRAGDGFDAEDVQESVESLLALARLSEPGPAWKPLLGSVETSRSGASVTVRYAASTGTFASTVLSIAAALVDA